jgi:hypothetical protein
LIAFALAAQCSLAFGDRAAGGQSSRQVKTNVTLPPWASWSSGRAPFDGERGIGIERREGADSRRDEPGRPDCRIHRMATFLVYPTESPWRLAASLCICLDWLLASWMQLSSPAPCVLLCRSGGVRMRRIVRIWPCGSPSHLTYCTSCTSPTVHRPFLGDGKNATQVCVCHT